MTSRPDHVIADELDPDYDLIDDTKTLTKQGYTKVKKKKRPYSTKLYDYL